MKLLALAEEEYANRWGQNPSEANDDGWIDTFHQGASNGYTFDSMCAEASIYQKMNPPPINIPETFNQ